MTACVKCQPLAPGHVESFQFVWNDGTEQHWSITEAKRYLKAAPRDPLRIDPDELPTVLANYTDGVIAAHVAHVDTDRDVPGIAITTEYQGQNHALLIDGYHRAAACLERGEPFLAYFLTEDEAKACEFTRRVA